MVALVGRSREGENRAQVLGDGAARCRAFGGEVGEHAGEFGISAGAVVEPGHGRDGHLGEQALQYGVPPGVPVQVVGGVGADSCRDQPGVVGAQGVLDEREGGVAEVEEVQGEQDGAAFGGGALFVEPGDGGQGGVGLDEEEGAYGVGVLGSAVPPAAA